MRDVGVTMGDTAITLDVQTRGDAELELWAAQRQRGPLEAVLGRPVTITARVVDDAEEPAPGRTSPAPAAARRRPRVTVR
ncbi:MAG: hypothetical protein U0P30_05800 [Vicinamibacterales bacterium]